MASGLLSPGPRSLRIDTSTLEPDYVDRSTKSPSEGPSIRTRARALSQVALPSLRILSSPSSDKAPASPLFPPATPGYSAPTKEKAEYQKLVELQLDQLRRRPRAPPFHEFHFQTASHLRNKSKHSTSSGPTKTIANINNLVNQGDSDDEDTAVSFSSETAAVRAKHLRDVLQTAMDRGWDVFELRCVYLVHSAQILWLIFSLAEDSPAARERLALMMLRPGSLRHLFEGEDGASPTVVPGLLRLFPKVAKTILRRCLSSVSNSFTL